MVASAAVRHPKVLIGVVALVALMAAFSLPAVRSAAEDFLSIFRVKQVQPIAAPAIGSQPPFHPGEFITMTAQDEGQARTFASVQEAVAAGYALRAPANLPVGVSASPKVTVKEASEARFTVDRAKAEAAFAAAGVSGVTLDPKLDGAEFRVSAPAMAVLEYGDRLALAQGKSPELQGPAGMDYDALRTQALGAMAAFAPDTAAQLAAIGEWRTTLPVPVPTGTDQQTVTVDGVEGLAMSGGTRHPGKTVVVWQKDGVVYGLWGDFATADLVATANSLH